MLSKQSQGKISRRKGIFTELLASFWLRFKGYEIIERNYRPLKGIGLIEIDIIAKFGNTLCFVEVKYRDNKDNCAYSISYSIKQKISKTAESYISFHPEYRDYDIRFDAFLLSKYSFPMHIKNAWSF